jgi:hypothetical protein
VSTMIGLVVESLPGEMDAASDRGVERFPPAACAVRVGSSGRASARGTADHGRSNVPVRGADRGRAGPGSGPRARAPQTWSVVPPWMPLAWWAGERLSDTERW